MEPTVTQLIQALDTAKVRYEYYGECTDLSRFYEYGQAYPHLDSEYSVATIGIEIKRGVWAWFKILDNMSNDKVYYVFRERYNANIGKVLRSFKTRIRVCKAIQELTGLNLSGMNLSAWD